MAYQEILKENIATCLCLLLLYVYLFFRNLKDFNLQWHQPLMGAHEGMQNKIGRWNRNMKNRKKKVAFLSIMTIFVFIFNVFNFSLSYAEDEKYKVVGNYTLQDSKLIASLFDINSLILKNPKNYLKINDDGSITVNESIKDIVKDDNLILKYKECIKYLNLAIEEGIIEVKDDFSIQLSENIQLKNKSVKSNKNSIVIQRDPDEPERVYLIEMCRANVNELNSIYLSILVVSGNPVLAYSAKVAYWTSKVKEGGDWDYKRIYGWNKLYKIIVNGRIEYIHGEDIGNIHYGYTGRSLPLPAEVLCAAAGLVQILSGTWDISYYKSYFDDPKDQEAIRKGISWYEQGL
ncbi:polymorphic toxin type 44 domain-containing protein [Caldicellulosiruptor acetigenus]|nr:polymorphic toxin type 44 domain-containing protein [Caldicellulosiruptor acetigenus]